MHKNKMFHYMAAIIIVTLLHFRPTPATGDAKPGCDTHCGSLTVPFPFGLNRSCSLSSAFHLNCNKTFSPPKLFLPRGNLNLTVVKISERNVTIMNKVAYKAPLIRFCDALIKNGCLSRSKRPSPRFRRQGYEIGNNDYSRDIIYDDLRNIDFPPYSISSSNLFTVTGCGWAGLIYGISSTGKNITIGCLSLCSNKNELAINGTCAGNGCCQTPIPKTLKAYSPSLVTLINNTISKESDIFNRFGYAFMLDPKSFDLSNWRRDQAIEYVPMVLDWVIGKENCSAARNSATFACQENSYCVDSGTDAGGYRCKCSSGYEGNPYLSPGCRDINECDKNPCDEHAICENTPPGKYTCTCKNGYAKINSSSCIVDNSEFPVTKFSVGFSIGMLSLVIGITWLYFCVNKRKLSRMREDFFRQNGGFLLKQQMFGDEAGAESTKIFSSQELEKATNNYAEDRILGKGGYGIVYRGILPDQRVIAIKKSKIVEKSQIEQFINEVIILTRVNHRNVVKLLGCCLECEVPLLVYEFISNGTLFDHIHNNNESRWLSWKDRLRIAAETAGALSYLHSATSMPVIHRDIKSTNILLDDSYTAKVADFGASRLVPLNQTKVTTLVQGTLGYLDPEYFHTSQLTEKSDVYSFGVVLAELVTGKRPLSTTESEEERNLATYFITTVEGNRLFQIAEPRILKEDSWEQVEAIGKLVTRCLSIRGSERPTMKEVAMEIEGLIRLTMHQKNCQEHWEEKEALLGEHSGTPSDLNAFSVDMESTT